MRGGHCVRATGIVSNGTVKIQLAEATELTGKPSASHPTICLSTAEQILEILV
jgi:hypothetical protein